MSEPVRILLDLDTGVDDAMAICYALARPGIRLEACTTVFGNTEVENAARNTLTVLEMCGRSDVPVAAGASRPLLRPYTKTAGHIHGEKGLGNVPFPEPRAKPVKEHASDLIIRMARENPGALTLVTVAPLTNVALAFAKDPAVPALFKQIVCTGSTVFHPGVAAFKSPMVDPNFYNDPEAASIVIESGGNILLVGMDVTRRVSLTRPNMDRIARDGGSAGRKLMEITEFYYDFAVNRGGQQRHVPVLPGAGMNDPLAVAVAEDPLLVTTEPALAHMELHGEWTRGQVIADRRGLPGHEPNVRFCTSVDTDVFTERFTQAMLAL